MKHASLASLAAVGLLLVPSAAARIFTVNTTWDSSDDNPGDGYCRTVADPSRCSLRAAVQEANARNGRDIIALPGDRTYQLSRPGTDEDEAARGDLDVTGDLRIRGNSNGPRRGRTTMPSRRLGKPRDPSIDANGLDRIFDVHEGATLELVQVALRNGDVTNGSGGAIRARNAEVDLSEVTITGCRSAGDGAAVSVTGRVAELRLEDVGIRGNEGRSVVHLAARSIRARRLDVALNEGVGLNAGLTGVSWIEDSSFRRNLGARHGGLNVQFIATDGRTRGLILENVTITENQSLAEGTGGLAVTGDGVLILQHATIFDNDGGDVSGTPSGSGGFTVHGRHAEVRVSNSLIAGNRQGGWPSAAPDCRGGFESHGHVLVGDASACDFIPSYGDQVGDSSSPIDPGLAPGGWDPAGVYVLPLEVWSPAVDAGDELGCAHSDARGVRRDQDGDGDGLRVCDIGAYELLEEDGA